MNEPDNSTSKEVASEASDVMRSAEANAEEKAAAASALAQTGNDDVTSGDVASEASDVMRSAAADAKEKSAAASALEQRDD